LPLIPTKFTDSPRQRPTFGTISAMAPELHLDPDRLREQAATAAALADDLAGVLATAPDDPDARWLHTAAGRAARELAELAAALSAAAQAARLADDAALRTLRSW
jgi:hypothetical protein